MEIAVPIPPVSGPAKHAPVNSIAYLLASEFNFLSLTDAQFSLPFVVISSILGIRIYSIPDKLYFVHSPFLFILTN